MTYTEQLQQRGGIYDTRAASDIGAKIKKLHKQLRKPDCFNHNKLIEELIALQKTKNFLDWLKKNI